MGLEVHNPTEHPFDPAAIKKSVEDTFFNLVPPDARGAVVAIATTEYAGVAFAHKLDDAGNWKFVLQGDVTYQGKIDGQIKIIGTWK